MRACVCACVRVCVSMQVRARVCVSGKERACCLSMACLLPAAALMAQKGVDQAWCHATLLTCRTGGAYPSAIGDTLSNDQKTSMLLYLVSSKGIHL